MTQEERLTKAKVTLLINQPWFGQLACYINPRPTKAVPTACINERGDLFFNPDFLAQLDDKEVKTLLCHEILHLAFRHPFRVMHRDALVWNIAADLKVNQEIYHLPFFKLPKEGLVPDGDEWRFNGKSIKNISEKNTELIYDEVMRNLPKIPKSLLDKLLRDLMKSEARMSEKGLDVPASELPVLEREWQSRVNQANQAVGAGRIPAGLVRELAELENPELPWDQIIRQRFARLARRRTWMRPARKHLPLYTPGTKRETGLDAVCVIDTSASMSDKDLAKAISEIFGLAQSFPTIHLWIITNDADVWDVIEVKNGEKEKIKKIKLRGGGGTECQPVFKLVDKKFRDKIDCMVYFTDGDIADHWPQKQPSYPVYFVTQSDGKDWPRWAKKVIRFKTY